MISVAIDLDGVLASSLPLYRQIALEEGVSGNDWENTYNGMFKVKTSKGENFGQVLFHSDKYDLTNMMKPVDGAIKWLKKFTDNDLIGVHLVTSRPKEHEDDTINWLFYNGFKDFDSLLFTKDKTESPSNVIIDDFPKHVESYINKGRMGILIDAPYNQDYNRGTRVKNLEQAYYKILPYL